MFSASNKLSMIDLVGEGTVFNEPISDITYFGIEVPIACFIFLFCPIFVALYIAVLMGIRSERDYRNMVAYRIIVHMGVADIIQLGIHFTAGFQLLDRKERYGWLQMTIGAILNANWCTMLVLSILLNVNRFVSIIFHFDYNTVFSKRLTNIYLALCWIFCCFIIAINVSPLSRFYYVVPTYTWHYEAGHVLSLTIRRMSARLAIAEVVVAILAHGAIFTHIYLKAAILSKREMYLTIQVLSMGAFHVFGVLTWEYWPLPPHPLSAFFAHFIWMLWNGINPVLHLVISPRIRGNVLTLLRLQKKKTVHISHMTTRMRRIPGGHPYRHLLTTVYSHRLSIIFHLVRKS